MISNASVVVKPGPGSISPWRRWLLNQMTETTNALYKTELVRTKGPWHRLKGLGLATPKWTDWFNRRRLFGELGYVPSAEFEAKPYLQNVPAKMTGLQLSGTT